MVSTSIDSRIRGSRSPSLLYLEFSSLVFSQIVLSSVIYISFSFLSLLGVSQWANYGIDPSDYPRTLLDGCQQSISGSFSSPSDAERINATTNTPSDALNILIGEYDQARSKKVVGSCTACILSVAGSSPNRDTSSNPRGPCGTLDTANVGDTGYLILSRRSNPELTSSLHQDTNSHYEMCFKSQPQRSKEVFNCPYQMGYVTESPHHCSEKPNEDADRYQYPIYCDDIIVSGTTASNFNFAVLRLSITSTFNPSLSLNDRSIFTRLTATLT